MQSSPAEVPLQNGHASWYAGCCSARLSARAMERDSTTRHNDRRGDRNVGIIRIPVRAIALPDSTRPRFHGHDREEPRVSMGGVPALS